jgi:hypothetical protein
MLLEESQPDEPERFRWLKIVFFLLIPLAIVAGINLKIDLVKPLDFDEMIVSRTALQPHFSELWSILASGQSPHPPLNFLAVRFLYGVFGVSELTTRLPATIGFTVMEVCLFFFISKRSNAAWGALGMLLPLLTTARIFAVEAKPYGALLGWTGIALICWRGTAPGSKHRGWALAGLAAALACATSSHFFGALLGFPILAGETARWFRCRRIDWASLAVLSCNYLPLLFFIPILRASRQIHGIHPWQTPLEPSFILKSGDLLLREAAAPLMICILIAALGKAWTKRLPPVTPFPLDELAAAWALAMLPVAAFCGLRLAGIRVIEEKYLIITVIGVAILAAWSLHSLSGPRLPVSAAMVIVFLTWGSRDFVGDLHFSQGERSWAANFQPPAAADAFGPLPVVVETPIFATLENYAAPQIASRIYFVTDAAGREKYTGNDALDRSFNLNPRFFGPHVEPIETFEAEHPRFLIYESLPGNTSWMLQKYADAGARIALMTGDGQQRWYLVTH